MFHPIKAIKNEIKFDRIFIREFITAYKNEKQILESQAKLDETTHVPGYTKISD